MRGAALAEVHLDGVVLPLPALLHAHEVGGEAADHPLGGEHLRHLQARRLDLQPVLVRRGEGAPEEDLTARSAEHLIVGGDGHGAPARIDAVLARG